MTDFEFYFAFFALLLGLSVAEIAGGLATALGSRHRAPLGYLTPVLALFVLLDITGFWMFAWSNKSHVTISWALMFGGLFVTVTYYLAAASVFPRRDSGWMALDDHYWAQKRLVIGGVMTANLGVLAFTIVKTPPQWNDLIFFAWQAAYWLPLTLLIFTKRARQDLMLLSFMICYNAVLASGVLPSSQWGAATGI